MMDFMLEATGEWFRAMGPDSLARRLWGRRATVEVVSKGRWLVRDVTGQPVGVLMTRDLRTPPEQKKSPPSKRRNQGPPEKYVVETDDWADFRWFRSVEEAVQWADCVAHGPYRIYHHGQCVADERRSGRWGACPWARPWPA